MAKKRVLAAVLLAAMMLGMCTAAYATDPVVTVSIKLINAVLDSMTDTIIEFDLTSSKYFDFRNIASTLDADKVSEWVTNAPQNGSVKVEIFVTTNPKIATVLVSCDPLSITHSYSVTYTVTAIEKKAAEPYAPPSETQEEPFSVSIPSSVIYANPSAGSVTLTANVNVGTHAVRYQWQKLVNGVWQNISGATGSTLTLSPLTPAMNNTYYRCVISDPNVAGQITYSGKVQLLVN